MALPPLPPQYQQDAYEQIVRLLPGQWFHQLDTGRSPLLPLLNGVARSLAYLRYAYDNAQNASIPSTSGGPWLSLHLEGIGLTRLQGETDEQARLRYEWEFKPTRNTREGELLALSNAFGLEPPRIRIEGDRRLGRFGQFRLVLDDQTKPWAEIDYTFLGPFLRRYVTNGITPSLDARLQCLIFAPLPAWQFHDQFPPSWNILGPLWERPTFVTPNRLPFARNLIAQVSAPEWRSERDRLMQLFQDGSGDVPGAMFLYLSDPGHCPNLLAEFDLEIDAFDLDGLIPQQGIQIDGWQFYDQFPREAATQSNLLAPYLEVPAFQVVQAFPQLNVPEITQIINMPSADDLLGVALTYAGLDFSRLRVERFLDAPLTEDPDLDGGYYQLFTQGPWELRISTGLAAWGNFPPLGTAFVGTEFKRMSPSAVWWSDEAGNGRSPRPIRDADGNIYLHLEFLCEASEEKTLREAELLLDGYRVNYRRFALPVNEGLNNGFIYRVKGLGTTEVTALDLGNGDILDLGFGSEIDLGNGSVLVDESGFPIDLGFGTFLEV